MTMQKLVETIQTCKDPRRTSHGNVRHKLADIIAIALCSVICGGEGYEAMELIGRTRESFFRQFLELPNGVPSADTFRRVLSLLDPKMLAKCLAEWIATIRPSCEAEPSPGEVVAIDGKTIRGSADCSHKAFHVISAFVADSQITLGELAVPEKTNEINAVPELLDIIDVTGTIVTADAMSCQRKIAEKICKRGADYVIGLKGNQGEFHSDVALYFKEFVQEMPSISQTEKGHGRVEIREYSLCTDIEWLGRSERWKGLKGVGMVRSCVYHCKDRHETEDVRYFITSLTDVSTFARAVRSHWAIENQLHWSLDVIFKEDACMIRKDNAPLNMNVMRKVAMRLLNTARTGKLTKKLMMLKASLDPLAMLDVLFQRKK